MGTLITNSLTSTTTTTTTTTKLLIPISSLALSTNSPFLVTWHHSPKFQEPTTLDQTLFLTIFLLPDVFSKHQVRQFQLQ